MSIAIPHRSTTHPGQRQAFSLTRTIATSRERRVAQIQDMVRSGAYDEPDRVDHKLEACLDAILADVLSGS